MAQEASNLLVSASIINNEQARLGKPSSVSATLQWAGDSTRTTAMREDAIAVVEEMKERREGEMKRGCRKRRRLAEMQFYQEIKEDMIILSCRVLLALLPGASKSQIRASILKEQITVARIGQARSVLWTDDFQYNKLFFLGGGGQVKMSFGQVFFNLNLYFTCPNGQVVIKNYVAENK